MLPKLDVVGSSPIARSLEVVKLQAVPVAGVRTGPGDFFLGPIPASLTVSATRVMPTTSASRATERMDSWNAQAARCSRAVRSCTDRGAVKTVRGHIAYILAVDPRLGRRYQRRLMAV